VDKEARKAQKAIDDEIKRSKREEVRVAKAAKKA
jgi:hypothetical protein